jgi:D-3-phosphoglycerate dehydrogenase / 2-oxoglutarate reductase
MKKAKVLLFEKVHRKGLEYLEQQGCELVFPQAVNEEALLKVVPAVEGIIFRTRGYVSRRLMEAAPHLKVVGRHGVGLDNLDIDAATDLGIWVVSTPEANSQSVAEMVLSLALMLSRKIPQSMRALQEGRWEDRNTHVGQELLGRTLGIVGLGRVGSTIARIWHHGFGCPILFRDIVPKPEWESALGAKLASLAELLRTSDYVSLNVPLTEETRGMIGERELSMMKKSAFIINAARGPVWQERAVYKAITQGWIAGAAADVFEEEPTDYNNPLLRLENFVGTPHVAAHTQEAMQRMSMVAEDIVRVIRGKAPQYPANQPKTARQTVVPTELRHS